jgi:hypothetical protein
MIFLIFMKDHVCQGKLLNPFVQVFSFRLSANVVAKLHRDQNGITNNESVDSQAQISKDIGELSGGGCSSKV